jgi:hypothetical protein
MHLAGTLCQFKITLHEGYKAMRDAALPFIKAVIDGIQQARKLGTVLAVVVSRHGGNSISGVGHCCCSTYPLQDFTTAYAGFLFLVILQQKIRVVHDFISSVLLFMVITLR